MDISDIEAMLDEEPGRYSGTGPAGEGRPDWYHDNLLHQKAWDDLLGAQITKSEINRKVLWFQHEMIAFGEITHIYGKPGCGKTLLASALCFQNGFAFGPDTVYFNLDDSNHGLAQKLECFKDHGIKLVDGRHKTPEALMGILSTLAATGSLKGKIFVFDTLKKFVPSMINKRDLAAFFKWARTLTAAGATVITLGHANKHLDDDGLLVYEGTGDLAADVDCMYEAMRVEDPIHGYSTVMLRNRKSRGKNQDETGFKFPCWMPPEPGEDDDYMGYYNLLNKMQVLTANQLDTEMAKALAQELREVYTEVITMVAYFLKKNPGSTQAAVVEYWTQNQNEFFCSRRDFCRGLRALTGICWEVKPGSNNRRLYTLLPQ